MSRSSLDTEIALSDEELQISQRDRWATPIAIMMTSIQFVAGSSTFGWYYDYVPRIKKILEDFRIEISPDAVLVIRQSDLLVNYGYVLCLVGPAALAINFLVIRWLTKELGLIAGIGFGICGTAIPLTYMAYGHYVLHSALSKMPL